MVLACSLYSNKKYHYAVMDACQFFVRVTVPELTAVFDINFDRESSLENGKCRRKQGIVQKPSARCLQRNVVTNTLQGEKNTHTQFMDPNI